MLISLVQYCLAEIAEAQVRSILGHNDLEKWPSLYKRDNPALRLLKMNLKFAQLVCAYIILMSIFENWFKW